MYQLIDDLTFNFIIIELDQSGDTADRALRIKKVNPSASTLLGYGENELIDKPLENLCTPEKWQTTLARLSDDLCVKGFESEFITKTNKLFIIRRQ